MTKPIVRSSWIQPPRRRGGFSAGSICTTIVARRIRAGIRSARGGVCHRKAIELDPGGRACAEESRRVARIRPGLDGALRREAPDSGDAIDVWRAPEKTWTRRRSDATSWSRWQGGALVRASRIRTRGEGNRCARKLVVATAVL